MASDIFAKIGEIKGESFSSQLDHQLIKLGSDFDRVGDAFIGLIADALKVSEHKHVANIKYTDALIKHDVDTIGADFVKLGDGFLKLDEAQHKFDDAFLNFADQFIKIGNLEFGADFHKLDDHLNATGFDTIKLGLDFLKLNDIHIENPNATFAALAVDFHRLDDNLGSVGDDFRQIGGDFVKLGDIKLGDIKLGDIKLDESD